MRAIVVQPLDVAYGGHELLQECNAIVGTCRFPWGAVHPQCGLVVYHKAVRWSASRRRRLIGFHEVVGAQRDTELFSRNVIIWRRIDGCVLCFFPFIHSAQHESSGKWVRRWSAANSDFGPFGAASLRPRRP